MKSKKTVKKPVLFIDRQKALQLSKMSMVSRLKWLEEANKFVHSLRSPKLAMK
jgi:hypothetical protein